MTRALGGARPLRIALLVMLAILVSVTIAYAWALARVAGAFADLPPARADAAVILGAAVWPDGPSPALVRRTRVARDLHAAGRVTFVVTTGGLGRYAPPEGEASRAWLLAHDMPPDRIVVENRSHTTRENLAFAADAMRAHGIRRVLIVSDGYHLARGVAIAHSLGFEAWGVSADGPPRNVITRDPGRWFGEAGLYLANALGTAH